MYEKKGCDIKMLEIVYRIYEVADEETAIQNLAKDDMFGIGSSISKSRNTEIWMDCMVCDSRDQFKDSIRSTWGKDISFRYSSKLQPGDYYCIIIGEHCYNTERHFNKVTFRCDCCDATIETYYGKAICFSDYEINSTFYGIEDYANKRFCSQRCKQVFENSERKKLRPAEDQEFYIQKDMFTENVAGYIYRITKKSTGQFYVGQTRYAPVFRWGQHLKTERFPIKEIEDYTFEVLEIVPKSENILEREKYWIQTLYASSPQNSLNIAGTKNIQEVNA